MGFGVKTIRTQRALKASLAGSCGAATMLDEFWVHRILPTDRVPSPPRVSEVRNPLQWWSLSQESVLLGSVSRDGVRTVKMHTLLDLHGNIPTFIRITDGKVHDVNILDEFLPEAGAFYVMDRGYIDFERLFVFTLCSAFFVVGTKETVLLQRRYSHAVDKTTGVRSDHTVILTSFESASVYPDAFRRVTYLDVETKKRFKFLTNNFTLPAHVIAQIYKSRWVVESFFNGSSSTSELRRSTAPARTR
jgi:Transposase DDE domain